MFGFGKQASPVREFLAPKDPPSAQAVRATARAALDQEEAAWAGQEPRLVAAATAASAQAAAARAKAHALSEAAAVAEAELSSARSRMNTLRGRYRGVCIQHTEPGFAEVLQVWSRVIANIKFESATDRAATIAAYERLCAARLEVAPDWRGLVTTELAGLPPAIAATLRGGGELWGG